MWQSLAAVSVFAVLLLLVWALVANDQVENKVTGDPVAARVAVVCITTVYIALLLIAAKV